ncbi:hypothetical protein ACR776_03230 [Sphingobacterium spiritivorum]|uniref:hypothetical protein n=1 Tax=Sphingobacterium spiritivorum TaxID=258 RepID=UPI003DA63F88
MKVRINQEKTLDFIIMLVMKFIKPWIVLVTFISTVLVGICQDKEHETVLISSFVKDAFFTKAKSKNLADQFIIFPDLSNSKYTHEDRLKIFDKHLKKIREDKKNQLDTTDFQITPYQFYNKDKVKFSEEYTRDIFVLISRKKPIMYFLMKNHRILSFDYIIKGDEGLFITY